MSTRLTRAIAWLYAAALVLLTLGSPRYRFETVLPHNVEHLVALSISGLLFSIGYRSPLCLFHWPAWVCGGA